MPPLQKFGLIVVNIYLFIILSRIFDVSFSRLRIPMIFFTLSAIIPLLCGNPLQLFRTGPGILLVLMLGWVAVATAFSTWVGGSIDALYASAMSFVLALAIISLATTAPAFLRLMRTIAYATFFAALLSFFFGRSSAGRLVLYNGTYGDPNQYAMALLMGLPFWLMLAKNKSALKKLMIFSVIGIMLFVFLKTGSRGGGIGLMVLLTILFFQAKPLQKLAIAAAGVAALFAALFFLPEYLKVRYMTLFEADPEKISQLTEQQRRELEGDIGSSTGRLELLKDGIRMTIEHPLLGVGPNQFPMKNWEERKARGQSAAYLVTHNSYTQISSETGIPGLLIFIALLVTSIRYIGFILRLSKKSQNPLPLEIRDAGFYLRLSLVSVAVCSFFLSVAYSQLFYVMGAMAAAYYAAARRELPHATTAPYANMQGFMQPAAVPQQLK